jgi:hypothetical protein
MGDFCSSSPLIALRRAISFALLPISPVAA